MHWAPDRAPVSNQLSDEIQITNGEAVRCTPIPSGRYEGVPWNGKSATSAVIAGMAAVWSLVPGLAWAIFT